MKLRAVWGSPVAEPYHKRPAFAGDPAILSLHSGKYDLPATSTYPAAAAGLVLDDTIDQWYPRITDASLIKVRMLMNHSSGIADISQPQVDRHCADPHHFASPEELIQIGAALPPGAVRPRGWFPYSSVNTIILGRILEKVTNESHASLMRERLLKPLGLDRTKLDTDGSLEPPFFRLFPGCCASELEA